MVQLGAYSTLLGPTLASPYSSCWSLLVQLVHLVLAPLVLLIGVALTDPHTPALWSYWPGYYPLSLCLAGPTAWLVLLIGVALGPTAWLVLWAGLSTAPLALICHGLACLPDQGEKKPR